MTQAHPTGASPNARFLVGEMPVPPQFHGRRWEGTGLSIAAHAIVAGILIYAATHVPAGAEIAAGIPERFKVFLDRPGPGGARAGSGTPTPDPPGRVEPAKPLEITTSAKPADIPQPDVIIPVIAAQAQHTLPGALVQMTTTSPGRGIGPGDGNGKGAGSGPDPGSGLGPGRSNGYGGETFGIGNGVISPVLIKEVKPAYTVNAMQAKLQGVVEMEAVVLPDGSVDPGSIRVTRSLDSRFGLDQQAIIAVKQWLFRPGTLNGQPVAVRVNVELMFSLR
jgi:protein TonB